MDLRQRMRGRGAGDRIGRKPIRGASSHRSRPRPSSRQARRASEICPASRPAAPESAASAPRRVRRRSARLRRPAAADCRRAYGPRRAEDVPAVDIGLQRVHGPLRADDVQKCRADGGLDVEPRQRLAGTRTRDRRLGADDRRLDEGRSRTVPRRTARPLRFPTRCRSTPSGRTGPDIAGITDCGRTWPKMLLAVPRFDCHRESSRGRYADFATLTPAVEALTCSSAARTRRIVIDRVLHAPDRA